MGYTLLCILCHWVHLDLFSRPRIIYSSAAFTDKAADVMTAGVLAVTRSCRPPKSKSRSLHAAGPSVRVVRGVIAMQPCLNACGICTEKTLEQARQDTRATLW